MKRKKKLVGFLAVLFMFSLRGSFALAMNQDYFVESQSTDQNRRAYLGYMDEPHLRRGKENLTKGNPKYFKYALGEAKYVLDRFPNHPRGLVLMGVVAMVLRNPALAVVRYEKALKLFPQYAITHAQYGMFLVNNGQVKTGFARLDKAIAMEPKNMAVYKLLARAYMKVGNSAKAHETLEAGRRAASQSTTASPDNFGEEGNLLEKNLDTMKEQPQSFPLDSGNEEDSRQ